MIDTETEPAMGTREAASTELPDAAAVITQMTAADYSAPEADCDIIMKGGITSGVVYPLTICKLAEKYRMRSIGGTSAGAIAAVVAAAAEHRRQVGGADASEGFRRLAGLPNDVSTRLASLFQPMSETRGLYSVLLAGIDPTRKGVGKLLGVARVMIGRKLGWFLAGVLLAPAITLPGLVIATGFPIDGGGWARIVVGLVLPLLAGLVIGLVLAAVGLVLEARRILPTTRFGITDGATHSGDPAEPALTDWLADEIDEVAGIDDPDDCLTLGDLWGANAVQAWSEACDRDHIGHRQWELRGLRRIELEVMTTNLTLHRPYRLPFDSQIYMFDPAEMRSLFPERIVEKMKVAPAGKHNPETGDELWFFPGQGSPTEADSPMPGPSELPVIVMARMSLSFPGLISAVPLYAVDYSGDHSVVRMLFADGGVSSNFPMHFFDAMLPTRPTFGVNLMPLHPTFPDSLVWRPKSTKGGVIPRAQPFDSLAGYIGALLDTVQNWSDYTQLTQRGYADRVVEIRLSDDEGGLNLLMPPELVMKLVALGAAAGDNLLEFDFDVHRLVRYRVATARLTDALDRIRMAWQRDGGALYPAHLAGYPSSGAEGVSYLRGPKWSVADTDEPDLVGTTWRERDAMAVEALVAAVAEHERLGWPAIDAPWPQPSPIIRMAPR